MAVYKCDKCSFQSNYRSSLVRHLRHIHGDDRLPDNLAKEVYSKPARQQTNQLIELPKQREYYQQNAKPFNDSLTEYKLHEEEIRDKNGKSFLIVMSLIATVFAVVWFRKQLVDFYYSWKKDRQEAEAAKMKIINNDDGERNQIGDLVQIVPRETNSHIQRPGEPRH